LAIARAWREEVRAQLRLALPIVVVQLGLMVMGVVDGAFMGRVSSTHYAAVSLGHGWTFLFIIFGMGLLAALDPIISQAWGAHDETTIRRGLQRGLILAAVLTIPIGLCIWPARFFLELFAQPPAVVPIATEYARVSILGVPAFLAFVAVRQTLQAMHRLRPLLIVILLANLLNVFLDWVLIFGNLGMPATGAIGSAWATAISRWAMAISIIALAWPTLGRYLCPLDPTVFSRRPLVRMVRLGLPVGLQFMLEIGAFAVIGFLAGTLGENALAGHQLALTLASLSFMVPLGISMAASVRVGNAIGRGDEPGARCAARISVLGGAGVMLGFGVLFLAAPYPLARVMTDLDDILAVAIVLIPIAGVFQVFDGTQVVALGILRGAADTRVPMLIHLVGFWCLGMPLACYLAFARGQGPTGLWWGLVLGLASVAVIQLMRVRHLLAGSLTRLRIEDDAEGE
jgi:MATE family, multidrug efflux pump